MKENPIDKNIHWSFWAIVIFALIFNLMGVANLFSQLSPNIVNAMPEPYREAITNRPLWATIAFAIAVMGGVVGCLLLLIKKFAAYYLFIISLFGTLIATAHFHISNNFYAPDALIGSFSQTLVVGFLIWYSKWTKNKGWIG